MNTRRTTIERAFDLANSGQVASLTELRLVLKREGYGDARMQTDGASIQRQLTRLMETARGLEPRPPPSTPARRR